MGLGSLSPRVNVEQSKKQAKDLLEAFREGDPKALDRIRWNHPRFRGLTDAEIRERRFVLADAQLVVARLHYFESWPKLLRHIDTLLRKDPRVGRFEDAADAIIAGDVSTLTALLRANPELVHQRSNRAHEAPLLHYVAANGVEDYRQVSPPNAVEVATVLLGRGRRAGRDQQGVRRRMDSARARGDEHAAPSGNRADSPDRAAPRARRVHRG